MDWEMPDETRETYDRFIRELHEKTPADWETHEEAVLQVLFTTKLPIKIEDLWLRARIPGEFMVRSLEKRGSPPSTCTSFQTWTALSVEEQHKAWSDLSEQALFLEWQRLPLEERSRIAKAALSQCTERLAWFANYQRHKLSEFESLPQTINQFITYVDADALPDGAWQADCGWHIESFTGGFQRPLAARNSVARN